MRMTRVAWALIAFSLLASGVWSENEVFNGGFDTDVSGWIAEPDASIAWSSSDANSDPSSGSAEVTNSVPNNNDGRGVSQCLGTSVTAGAEYEYRGKAYIPAGQDRTGRAMIGLRWYGEADCMGSPVGSQPRRFTETLGAWVELVDSGLIAPAGAVSVEYVAFPSKVEAGGSLVAHFDDLLFKETPLFADDFESGDITSWSSFFLPLLTVPPYADQSRIAGLWWPYCDSGDCPWEPPTQLHDGLDFTPTEDLVPFQAAAHGVVYDVAEYFNPGNGFWQVNVSVSMTDDNTYGLIYAFEPMTSSTADRDWQLANIDVQAGQVLAPGDVIGRLVQAAEWAHVHFGIWMNWQQTCPEPFLSDPVFTELRDLIQRDNPTWEICN